MLIPSGVFWRQKTRVERGKVWAGPSVSLKVRANPPGNRVRTGESLQLEPAGGRRGRKFPPAQPRYP